MAPWIKHIIDWVGSLAAKVAHLFSPAVDAITKAIEENSDKIQGDAVDFFEQAAMNAVKAAAENTGSNSDKAAAALASFTGELTGQGILLAENVAKLLLEAAYAKFKAGLNA